MNSANPTAAMLIIGNEILTGRTADKNVAPLAKALLERGIDLRQVRVVRDEKYAIVDAINQLRGSYTMVFTSGGIGPTHDDITTNCVAAALGIEITRDAGAEKSIRDADKAKNRETNDVRLRMADVPVGAELIYCKKVAAPGYKIANVYCFAGVPLVFAEMLAAAADKLEKGIPLLSKTITFNSGESEVANELEQIQKKFKEDGLEVGSYPQSKGEGKDKVYFADLVFNASDTTVIEEAIAAFTDLLGDKKKLLAKAK